MSAQPHLSPLIAIACGGTGGHLFPGLAVAEKLQRRGCAVTLMISPKEVDQQAVRTATDFQVVTLPAVGLERGRQIAFVRGFGKSYLAAHRIFRCQKPQAALAMGGFTSAPPMLAAKRAGAKAFFHESNTIPGRANRMLSWFVDQGFVGFASTAARLRHCRVTVSGTPVRPQFQPREPACCRVELGLDPNRPVVLVMGGSQGARGLNELILRALPVFASNGFQWQWFHLAGVADALRVQQVYQRLGLTAVVHPFFERMELAFAAASAAITRAGASTLAELAAMRLPALLVPYPSATNNHQFHNASAYATNGAARLLAQREATPEKLLNLLPELVAGASTRETMQAALARWERPQAADQIAEQILKALPEPCPSARTLFVPVSTDGGKTRRPFAARAVSAKLSPKEPVTL